MSGWEDELVDAFLAEVEDDAVEGDAVEGDGPAILVEALAGAAETPAPGLRERIMASAVLDGRFDRFIPNVAELLDIDAERAKELLDGIGKDESWYVGLVPDVSLYDVEGGPAVQNAITGFLRLPAMVPFPEHGHLGTELSLIIQGSGIDDRGRIWNVGDIVERTEDDVHSFHARPGPDLVFLVVVQNGIELGGQKIGPDDPRM